MRSLAAAALALLLASPARAVFVKAEMDALDTEHLFDSEYFLDLLSFRDPLEWRWAWQAAPLGYRINGASLDRTDLFLEQELKAAKRLNNWLSFSYLLDQRGDKDLNRLNQRIFFDFGPWRGFKAGLFGEPSFDKQDADLGFRAAQAFGAFEASAAATFVDFPFNERNKNGENYARKPVDYQAALGWSGARDRAKAWFDLELPLVRETPASGRTYGYRRTTAGLSWDRPSSPDTLGWRASYAYEFKKEEDRYQPATNSNLAVHRKVNLFEGAAEGSLTEKDRWEAGALFMHRGGLTHTFTPGLKDARHKRWELQPYGRWRRTVKPWAVREVALFLSGGEDYRIFPGVGPDKRDTVAEAKLGFGYDLLPSKDGRIGFYGTFDLDDAGRHIWDGGNVRAMFFF
ncbi:MAG: hypothetical protein FD126_2376 [Elusimicrobia bacterium]|nr:MAG: hypothetical protein FD126_2376 [Elusimicrobiota bacterium]